MLKILITILIALGLMINPAFAKGKTSHVRLNGSGRSHGTAPKVYHSWIGVKSKTSYGQKTNLGKAI